MGITDFHFDIIVAHLGATLTELGVTDKMIGQAAAVAETTRADIVTKKI